MKNARTSTAGFTLIELIVTMIVFAIIIAATLPSLIESASGGRFAASRASANLNGALITQQLESELHEARAPLASGADVRDGEVNTISDLAQASPLYHDIFWASPSGIAFWTDTLSMPGKAAVTATNTNGDGAYGSELVTYYLYYPGQAVAPPATPPDNTAITTSSCVQTPQPQWCIYRQVKFGPNMPAAVGSVTTELLATGAISDAADPFPYDNTCLAPDNTQDVRRIFCYRWSTPVNDTGSFNRAFEWAPWSDRCRQRPNAFYNDDELNPEGARVNTTSGMWNSGAIATFHPRLTDVSGNAMAIPGNNGDYVQTRIFSIDRISAVGIVLPGASSGRNASSDSTTTTVALHNRGTNSYLQAITCGMR